MNARTSKYALVLFFVVLVLSAFVSATPGGFWPLYAVMAVFAVVPLTLGPRRFRLFGAGALVFAGVLIATDYVAGKRFSEKLHHVPSDGKK